jgi:hypothetical protein
MASAGRGSFFSKCTNVTSPVFPDENDPPLLVDPNAVENFQDYESGGGFLFQTGTGHRPSAFDCEILLAATARKGNRGFSNSTRILRRGFQTTEPD